MPRRPGPQSNKPQVSSTTDLARYLGLSEWTVSRAINGHSEVKDSTRKRVLQAMEEIGFQPNPLARGLNGKSTGLVGICFGNPRNPLMADKIASLDEFLRSNNLRGVLAITPRDEECEGRIIADFRHMRVDGVIMIQSYVGFEKAHKWLEGMKSVHVDSSQPELQPYVTVNRHLAMRLIMDHLVALGHRTFAAVGFSKQNRWRWEGILDAMRFHKLDPATRLQSFELTDPGRESFAEGIQLAQLTLTAEKRPTAWIAVNDQVAAGAIQYLKDSNVRVPEDISVTGFDNLEVGCYLRPTITTIDQRPLAVMRRAGELLLSQIKGKEEGLPQAVQIEPALMVRESTGRAAR